MRRRAHGIMLERSGRAVVSGPTSSADGVAVGVADRRGPVGLVLMIVELAVGLRGDAKLTVGDADTARHLGSGDVDVLGTPRVIALCEEATCSALAGVLGAGTTSVAMRVQIDHLQPTAVGQAVTADAVLERIEGRRLTFNVSAFDAGGLVAAGKVTRVVVDVERFLGKCH